MSPRRPFGSDKGKKKTKPKRQPSCLIVAMSPRRPFGSDKGKKKTKPKRQPSWYIIRVLGQIPQSAPIQAPSLATVPTSHPAGVTTPSTSILSPSPYVVPTPHPTMQDFSTRLSQVRSEQGSCANTSEHDDDADKEDVIRTQCWVDVVGEKNKGRLYGTRELGKGFTAGRGIHKQQPSSSNAEEAVNRLTQRLEEHDQAYENLRTLLGHKLLPSPSKLSSNRFLVAYVSRERNLLFLPKRVTLA
ncbi:hypothetical protein DEO72_LG7g910 [Vigna unguiculata]|uniref:Uncharacterized protein n=1 Tax=Vigna unguiculata TaxID=3917 RepID=A0A4D6MHZ6_VIGUN|nr:hypothetical protein DEO72_LG7g910 [Vigna unguiculata]